MFWSVAVLVHVEPASTAALSGISTHDAMPDNQGCLGLENQELCGDSQARQNCSRGDPGYACKGPERCVYTHPSLDARCRAEADWVCNGSSQAQQDGTSTSGVKPENERTTDTGGTKRMDWDVSVSLPVLRMEERESKRRMVEEERVKSERRVDWFCLERPGQKFSGPDDTGEGRLPCFLRRVGSSRLLRKEGTDFSFLLPQALPAVPSRRRCCAASTLSMEHGWSLRAVPLHFPCILPSTGQRPWKARKAVGSATWCSRRSKRRRTSLSSSHPATDGIRREGLVPGRCDQLCASGTPKRSWMCLLGW